MTNTSPRAGRPALPAWLSAMGLLRSDLAAFGDDLTVRSGMLHARHRDADGHVLGVERVWEAAGEVRYSHTKGGRRGVVVGPLAGTPARILVADGALPVLCAAACDGMRDDTAYVGLPGAWSAVAAARIASLVLDGAGEIVLALAGTEAGQRSVAAAVADLRPLRSQIARLARRAPPAGGWPAALRALRRGAPADGRAAA